MSDVIQIGGHDRGFGATKRGDVWWLAPMVQGSVFAAFAIYTTIVMFAGAHYWVDGGAHGFGGYLSPMYSPLLFVDPSAAGSAPIHHAWFGEWPTWLGNIWPGFIPRSPAFFILIFPLAFRLTCYYYRKFYYRAYFLSPPACAVGGIRQGKYKGETGIARIMNIHRYAFYAAAGYIVILSYDAVLSYFRGGEFGIGVGSIVLTINPILLGLYTFGCHSCRHLCGGRINRFSEHSFGHRIWSVVTRLNEHHMFWAWVSMLWVWGTDVYVRAVSMGIITDFNTWGH